MIWASYTLQRSLHLRQTSAVSIWSPSLARCGHMQNDSAMLEHVLYWARRCWYTKYLVHQRKSLRPDSKIPCKCFTCDSFFSVILLLWFTSMSSRVNSSRPRLWNLSFETSPNRDSSLENYLWLVIPIRPYKHCFLLQSLTSFIKPAFCKIQRSQMIRSCCVCHF